MPTIPYKLDGERIPGTTSVISMNCGWNKQQLMWWANQEGLAGRSHRDTAQRAADAGTVGHYLIDCHIRGIKPDVSQYRPEVVNKGETAYLNFLEWLDMVAPFEPYMTEVNLVSRQYRYGATPDLVAYVRGKLCLLDWKTGNGVYPDHKIQLSAYKVAWEENYPDKPLHGFHLLRIDKETAAFAHYYWHALPEAWEAFMHLLALERLRKELK